MKINGNVILACILTAVFAGAIAMATTFPPVASVFPYLIGGLGLALALASVLVELRAARLSEAGAAVPVSEMPSAQEQDEGRQREISAGLWIIGFFAAIGLVGFQWGLPVVVALNYRFECGLRPLTAILLGLLAAGFIYATLTLLHIPLYEGVLFSR